MKKSQITPVKLVYILFTAGIAAMLLSLILSKGVFLEKMVFDFSYFVDFFDHVRRFYLGLDSVYAEGMHACFPPMAYCLYYLVACILYRDNIGNPEGLNTSGSGMLVICMLTAVFALVFVFAFLRMYQGKNMGAKKYLAGLLFCSYPFWLAIERGNMSLMVLVLLMYAMSLRNSGKRWERELALVLFALAASLKLYPAVFGILYLVEKRYKEAARLVCYGILCFFSPFIFFQGIAGFRMFLRNLMAVNSGATGITIVGLCGRLGEKLGLGLAQGHAVGKGISYLYFVVVLLVCCKIKKSWKTVTLLTSLMIVFVAASGTYCLVYSVIPFLCFLNDLESRECYRKMDYVYAVLFTLVFVAYPFRVFGSSGMLYFAFYGLLLVLLMEQAVMLMAGIHAKRKH